MSRKKTNAEDIRNPEHYFNRYLACEKKHDLKVQREIAEYECSLEEKAEHQDFLLQLASNRNGEYFDTVSATDHRFVWLESIQCDTVYNAIQNLTERQKLILTLRFYELWTLEEIANYLGCTRKTAKRHLEAICKQIVNSILKVPKDQ